MDIRKIGGTGLISSAIGLGCGAFDGSYGRTEEAESADTIRQALDLGITMFDMADFYGGGRLEQLVGRAIRSRRDEAVIATRGGLRFTPTGRPTGLDGSPAHLRRACDASLRRLGVDWIDLYYLADVDPDVPVEESIGQLAELTVAGKIRHIGIGTTSAQQLRRGHAVHPIAALSGQYSLWERGVEIECLPAARELGVTLVACRPLGRGILTGRAASPDWDDPADSHGDTHFSRGNLLRSRRPLRAAEEMAARMDVGLGRLALAWLLSQPGIVPVPGTRNPLHLEMNATAAGLRLAPGAGERLAALFPRTASNRQPWWRKAGTFLTPPTS